MSLSLEANVEDEELAELIAKAKEESLRYYNEIELPRHQQDDHKQNEENKDDILSSQVGGKSGCILYEGVEAEGFHLSAGSTYIYPTNYPVRHYQASIVKTALFTNTLVSLPTGLGKTFIAAVVMYNFYRWYPHGKVVFMAPTRPLVAQQTKACHHIMNIPQSDTTEMTGAQSSEQRSILWKEKRVFYLTPQVMVNDLKAKACPASLIKCIVIDEAHRATKDYAYCQVLKLLSETDAVFRVLGLSATPGNDINAVKEVIQNLQISSLEMRSEESLDVVPYVHSRSIDTVVVDLSENIQRVKEDLLQIYEKYAKKLKDFKALSSNISSISRFQVLKASEKFRANPPRGVPPAMIGSLISDFSVCMSLAHALELLQIYGLRAFYNYLSDDSGEKTKTAATRLKNDEHLKEMLNRLQCCLFPKMIENVRYTWGHPKLQKLVTALTEHFQTAENNKESTKAIIFCQYRVVVSEIVDLLIKCKPLIKATEFIGQSGGKEKGMPQVKQLQIMKDFRSGLVNCLVATCVAEEGLDIGEVDLIILMEAHKSPIRLVQRIGRTGRKRKGKCIVLLTRGKEEQKFHDAMATRKSYVKNIVNAPAVKSSLAQESPRMIPPHLNPVQQLVHIHASNFESPARPASKKQADIRKCFTAQTVPAHTSESDLQKAKEELGDLKLSFDSIPKPQELWHKRHDEKIILEDLLSKDINGLSEWNEWNYEEHPTYYINHTLQSKLLCHLLKVASKEISLPEYDKSFNFGLNDGGEEKVKSPEKKKSKKVTNKKMGMDIRDCMALVVDKIKSPEKEIIEILSDVSEDGYGYDTLEPQEKKLKLDSPEKSNPLFFNEKLMCAYEENNNICSLLSSYMLPKSPLPRIKTKITFNLPNLNMLTNLNVELLFNLNFNSSKESQTNCDVPLSPALSAKWSPRSDSFFEIDDLFDNENSGQDKLEFSNSNNLDVVNTTKNLKELLGRTSPTKTSNDNSKDVTCLKPNSNNVSICKADELMIHEERDKHSSASKVNENLLNEQINSDLDISFNDDDDEFMNVDIEINSIMKSGSMPINNANRMVPPPLEKENIEVHNSSDKNLSGMATPNISFVCKPGQDLQNSSMKPINNYTSPTIDKARPVDVDLPIPVDTTISDTLANWITPQKCAGDSLNTVQNSENISKVFYGREPSLPTSAIACSTPLVSVKKFKKNIIKLENSMPPVLEKEEDVRKKSVSSEDDDLWNLSDLFEEDEENMKKGQDTTMLGITQMVSLIEKEKSKNQISNSSAGVTIVNDTESSSKKSVKTSDLSYILDSDVDIFSDISENISVERSITQTLENNDEEHKKKFIDENINPNSSDISFSELLPNNKMTFNELQNKIKKQNFTKEGLDSEKTNAAVEPSQQSQPVNFKKFSSKKILFAQKTDAIMREKSSEEFHCLPMKHELSSNSENSFFNSITKDNHALTQCTSTVSGIANESIHSENTKTDFITETKPFFECASKSNQKSNVFERNTPSKPNRFYLNGSDNEDDVFLIPCNRKKVKVGPKSIDIVNDGSLLPSHKSIFSENEKSSSSENKKSNSPESKKSNSSDKNKTKKSRRNKNKGHNELIETEADVSGCDSDDDTDGSSLDELDNSFINDDTECMLTQTMYLKSVKSPVGRGKFKIPNNIKYDDNIFSQQIPEDSEYVNDSFCVDSEELTDEEHEKSLSLLEIAEQKLLRKNKVKKGKGKHRRILEVSSESPSPERSCIKTANFSSQPSPKPVIKTKKRKIQSESESEISPQKDVFPFKKLKRYPCFSPDNSKGVHMNTSDTSCGRNVFDIDVEELSQKNIDIVSKKHINDSKHENGLSKKANLDRSLKKLTKKFAQNLSNIRNKYFGSDDSSD